MNEEVKNEATEEEVTPVIKYENAEGEEIEILELSYDEAKELLKSDEVVDARTMLLIQYMIINNLMD